MCPGPTTVSSPSSKGVDIIPSRVGRDSLGIEHVKAIVEESRLVGAVGVGCVVNIRSEGIRTL